MKNLTTFSICICTYKRPELLRLLIADIAAQSLLPDQLIIVDGDPASGEVKALLENSDKFKAIVYLASNHPNLAFQRYLGWRIAQTSKAVYLIYLDDDLRIFQPDAIEKLLAPLQTDEHVVGATGEIRMGAWDEKFAAYQALQDRSQLPGIKYLLDGWGSARYVPPGDITPMGNRTLPAIEPDQATATVRWLRGGVMAYSLSAIQQDCFSTDLFAMDHIRCGKGEDTFFSRRVMRYGKLVYTKNAVFEHPNSDLPKTYPTTAYRYGFSSAYSRRFLNDHYRVTQPPNFADRLALGRTYLGNNLINLAKTLAQPRRYRLAYAAGYFVGSLRGIYQKPTSRNLTPEIDWWGDAEKALAQAVIIR